MRKALRTLYSRVERVMRDVERQIAQVPDSGRATLIESVGRTKRIVARTSKGRTKLHALHARRKSDALPKITRASRTNWT